MTNKSNKGWFKPKSINEVFWSHVSKSTGCWLWTGFKEDSGYGRVHWAGSRIMVHRLSWLIHHGDIPGGLLVCHRCDVTACVNPEHLFLGTHLDNMRDCKAKGRTVHGVKNQHAKLTDEAVRAIKQLRRRGVFLKDIATLFGVSQRTAWEASVGRSWSHVDVAREEGVGDDAA